jgi:chromosome segregation ATPase
MPAIDQAQARRDRALDRLERAIEARRASDDDDTADPALKSEVEGLRDECQALRLRLGNAEGRHDRLKDAMAEMGTRLDSAIAELDSLIEASAAD